MLARLLWRHLHVAGAAVKGTDHIEGGRGERDEDVGRRLPRCACGLRGGAQGQRPARRNFARLTWLKNFAASTHIRAFAPKSRKISLTPPPWCTTFLLLYGPRARYERSVPGSRSQTGGEPHGIPTRESPPTPCHVKNEHNQERFCLSSKKE